MSRGNPSRPRDALRVLMVGPDPLGGPGLKAQLDLMGLVLAGQSDSVAEAMALYQSTGAQIVLLDAELGGVDVIDMIRQMLAQREAAIILLSDRTDIPSLERAADAGVYDYLFKPVVVEALRADLELSQRWYRRIVALQAENEKLRQDMETRKLMERAKGILMKRGSLSEEEAHRRLQQESQKRRINLAELCRRIIESDELMS